MMRVAVRYRAARGRARRARDAAQWWYGRMLDSTDAVHRQEAARCIGFFEYESDRWARIADRLGIVLRVLPF